MKIVNVNIDGLLGENEMLTANYIKQNKFDLLNLQEKKFSKTNDITNNHKKAKRFFFSNSNYLQLGVATLVLYEALNYKIKQILTKDYISKNGLLKIQADQNLNIINIYALVINDYQMKIEFYNIK